MSVLRLTIIVAVAFLSACSWYDETRVQGYVYQEPIYMSSSLAGMLNILNVERGQWVKAGTPLFSLDPEPQTHDLQAAKEQLAQATAQLNDLKKASRETVLEGLEGQVAQAQAALDIAQKKAARFEALFTKKVLDAESRDEAVADASAKTAALASAQANLAEAQQGARVDAIVAQEALVASSAANVASAQWALEQKTVFAPIDALVFDTFYRPGENVGAARPVVELLDPNRLYAVFFISEPLLSEVCLGQEVRVAHDRERDKIPAMISYIASQAEYTPPVIYSRDNNQVLVFRIQATMPREQAKTFHSGQPVDVYISEDDCDE